MIQGIVPNCGLKWDSNPRRGRPVTIPKYGQFAKKMRENSSILSAGKLFNSLPRELRDDSVSKFPVWKAKRDILLDETPDYPRSDEMISPHICYITNKNTNSLYTIFRDMNIDARKFNIDINDIIPEFEEEIIDWDDYDLYEFYNL